MQRLFNSSALNVNLPIQICSVKQLKHTFGQALSNQERYWRKINNIAHAMLTQNPFM